MTTTFEKREEAFEKQFAHDQDLRFKALARSKKAVGLWAASLLGKTSADAEAYAKELVITDFDKPGEAVLSKLTKDLQGNGITEQEIRTKMFDFLEQAINDIKKSG